VAVAPGWTFAHEWRVTLELVESELSLVNDINYSRWSCGFNYAIARL